MGVVGVEKKKEDVAGVMYKFYFIKNKKKIYKWCAESVGKTHYPKTPYLYPKPGY